ncbi:uncharacterized protein LOC126812030 isoform X2 [Patella vulgata]|uniref:uncharacterized protein LOC126812030 isoform X2 n=1 Tax=Patella vulgata TaxID=6465 RepID=UPI0024A7D0C7|nr:uncharacterized protein LOC126812030 isoform X2 [Patella vulgata]
MRYILLLVVLLVFVLLADGKKRRKFRTDSYGEPRPGPHPPAIGHRRNRISAARTTPPAGANSRTPKTYYWRVPAGYRMVPRAPERPITRSVTAPPEPHSGEYIRLRGNASSFNAGRIEVYRGRKWGIVCDDEWDLQDASVACRQLGFKQGALSAIGKAYYGIPAENTDILMDNVNCKGSESTLQSCPYTTVHDCSKSEAASVVCKVNEGCDPGWVAWDGSCYKFFGGARNLKQAIEKCAALDAGLVTIQSQAENNFLSNVIKLTARASHVWYTGGKRMKRDWKWFKVALTSTLRLPGRRKSRAPLLTKAAMEFDNWFPGWGPNSYAAEPLALRRYYCLVLTDMFLHPNGTQVQVDYFYWAAKVCASRVLRFDFICEKEGQPEPLECYKSLNGSEYRGFASVTEKGSLCLNWTDSRLVNPQTHPDKGLGQHNLCRNPDGDAKPWCWVDHRLMKFGYCSVPACNNDTVTQETQTHADCPGEEFFCSAEKTCINKEWHCDGEQDCSEGEDEIACDYAINDFVQLQNRVVTEYNNRIDYINSTLEFCAKKCLQTRDFVCRSVQYGEDSGDCFFTDSNAQNGDLEFSLKYDYYQVKSQTENCTGQFMCKNNKCIPMTDVCNGQDNCNDFSDEQDCDTTTSPLEIRLVGGSEEHSGRLEIKYMDEWGTICDDQWDIKDSNVACRMLGYPGAEKLSVFAEFGPGEGNILLTDVQCIGNETSLEDCDKSPWRKHSCNIYEAVGLYCRTEKVCESEQFLCDNGNCIRGDYVCNEEDDCGDNSDEAEDGCIQIIVELVNGTRPNEGRVEIIRNGIKGTVCDDEWGEQDAEVVCKELGYKLGGKVVKKGTFGQGSGIIWLDNVKCDGTETSIEWCDGPAWGVHDCDHEEDAGVFCYIGSETETELKVELVDGKTPNEGRVEITLNGERGTICDDGWDNKDATVICRMLGYREGGKALVKSPFGGGRSRLPVITDEVDCTGRESSLEECDTSHWFEHDCDHDEDAGVHCFIAPEKNQTVSIAKDTCGQRAINQHTPRIAGGFLTVEGSIPWQANVIKILFGIFAKRQCGAAILSDTWLISAAHCYDNLRKNRIVVNVGDHSHKRQDTSEQQFEVAELIPHFNYNRRTHDFDVALIRIKPKNGKGIIFSDYVQPICLPSSDTEYTTGARCLVSGWGDTGRGYYPDLLKAAVVPLLDKRLCNRLYRYGLSNRMLCAGYVEGGIDTCQGDSGGPLACRINDKFTLMGVTSFGNGCAKPNSPGVYSRVSSFIGWINENTK